jgi:asparagine synthase (glutamine-hydrolysing)
LKTFNIKKLYKKASALTDSTKMQYIDIKTWLIGDILQKGDKMSMAQSLEVRTPFLDRVVSDFAKKIPDNLKYKFASDEKITGQDTKYLLRKVAQKLSAEIELNEDEEYLRDNLKDRKRVGFVMPLAE